MTVKHTEKSTEPSALHIIGPGAWGSALALAYSRFSPLKVSLWSRTELHPERPFPRLPNFLPHPSLVLRQGLPEKEDLTPSDIIFFVTPAQTLREVSLHLQKKIPFPIPLVSCCKGIEKQTNLLPLEILEEIFPNFPRLALGGPNFAEEIANNLPAAANLASRDSALAKHLAKCLSLPSFSLFPSSDPVGIQLVGASKNVIAIGVGATKGAGLGENACAAFITYFIQELSLLIPKAGGNPETVFKLGGIGDLLLTATSSASRNYALGEYLGKNASYPPDYGSDKAAIVEGSFTAPALLGLAERLQVSLPAVRAVKNILDNPSDIEITVRSLLKSPA